MKIRPEQAGLSVEDFLGKTMGLGPRAALKRAFLEKNILINDRPAKRQDILKTDDVVSVNSQELFTRDQMLVQPAPELALDVLRESADLLVINKPAGQNAHPLKPTEHDTTLNAIAARFSESAKAFAPAKPLEGGLVHRLDRGTSGILLCARTPNAWTELREAFSSREVVKIYAAWVEGDIKTSASYDCFLSHDPKSKKRMLVSAEEPKNTSSWWTRTSFMPLKTVVVDERPVTFMLIRLHTGVTHQIRAVAAHLGHPVLGDKIYSAEAQPFIDAQPIDAETQKYFEHLRQKLELHAQRSLNPANLPSNAFFLHALYLRSKANPLLTDIFAPLPAYFMIST